MNCPACDAALDRMETHAGLQVAVVYQCTQCVWCETMYFDTLDDETEVK